MRLAGLMLAALTFVTGGLGPVPAQQKTIPEGSQAASPAPLPAERAFLHEGQHDIAGSVRWRTETLAPRGGANGLAIVGESEIPERRMQMILTVRHNTDRSLPVSHTIDLVFKLAPDALPGAILNVPGIWMTQGQSARGAPLLGLAVKITNGFFLIGLSEAPADREHNVAMLKERARLDIPIVFANHARAMLALEKGATGDAAFTQAFAEWEK
jgi:hypothetical protein